eukprot:6866387-Prymnesium_polylepis.1
MRNKIASRPRAAHTRRPAHAVRSLFERAPVHFSRVRGAVAPAQRYVARAQVRCACALVARSTPSLPACASGAASGARPAQRPARGNPQADALQGAVSCAVSCVMVARASVFSTRRCASCASSCASSVSRR